MKLKLVLCISILATSVARADDPIKQYKDAMDFCAGQNMVRYDDGVSPANVVAKVLLGICRRQNQGLYEGAFSGRTKAWKSGFDGAQFEQFTGYVLWHRAN